MSDNVKLRAASDDDFTAMIAGFAPTGYRIANGGIESDVVLTMLRGLAQSVRSKFDPAAWMIVMDDEVVGLCSLLHAPDDAGQIAIGYGVAASRRGHGCCGAAIAQLAQWASGHPQIHAITAETATTNLPSQAVLSRNGFMQIGTRHDAEDGALICWRLALR